MIEVIEGQQLVTTYTDIVLRANVANQMSAPTGATLQEVRDLNTDTDVTSTIAPSGSASIEDTTYVRLPALESFTANREYSVRFSFTDGSNTLPGEIKLRCVF